MEGEVSPFDKQIVGHTQQVETFLDRARSGRLGHAWILKGPRGIGKAGLAHLFAGSLLGAELHLNDGIAKLEESAPVLSALRSGAHPDLRVVEAQAGTGKSGVKSIVVDDIRSIVQFFALCSGMDGRRIVIIDAIDELNINGINALLKTLEEPPQACLLFLIYHGEKALIPTVRSRCQVLTLQPLEQAMSQRVLREYTDAANDVVTSLEELLPGQPGRIVELAKVFSSDDIQRVMSATTQFLRDPGYRTTQSVLAFMNQSEQHFRLASLSIARGLKLLSTADSQSSSRSRLALAWTAFIKDVSSGEKLQTDLSGRSAFVLSRLQDRLTLH